MSSTGIDIGGSSQSSRTSTSDATGSMWRSRISHTTSTSVQLFELRMPSSRLRCISLAGAAGTGAAQWSPIDTSTSDITRTPQRLPTGASPANSYSSGSTTSRDRSPLRPSTCHGIASCSLGRRVRGCQSRLASPAQRCSQSHSSDQRDQLTPAPLLQSRCTRGSADTHSTSSPSRHLRDRRFGQIHPESRRVPRHSTTQPDSGWI